MRAYEILNEALSNKEMGWATTHGRMEGKEINGIRFGSWDAGVDYRGQGVIHYKFVYHHNDHGDKLTGKLEYKYEPTTDLHIWRAFQLRMWVDQNTVKIPGRAGAREIDLDDTEETAYANDFFDGVDRITKYILELRTVQLFWGKK